MREISDLDIQRSAKVLIKQHGGSAAFARPSHANEHAFNHAVERVTAAAQELLGSLVTSASPRNREIEAAKARERATRRFTSQ